MTLPLAPVEAEPHGLTLRIVPFSARTLTAEVERAARARWSDAPAQVRYLAAYLADREVGASTMLVEVPYVDRHYIQEYVGYYATTLRPAPPSTTRIHFWRRRFDGAAWDELLETAADGRLEAVQGELAKDYLGYVVVRPVPSCPIGRTVLGVYEGRASRCYAPATSHHDVHLAGFTFRVKALPFQQQDQGLGACATTALWTALARVMRADGGRAATPLDVARSVPGAEGQLVARPEGLDVAQMTATVRALGYAPHYLTPSHPDVFLLALKTYVRSGIPVILRLRVQPSNDVHAVTVAGMREHDDDEIAADIVLASQGDSVASAGLTRLYLHDDRLGPYGRFVFSEPSPAELRAAKRGGWAPPLALKFEPRKRGFEEYTQPAQVESAIVPLYPKIRTTAEGLIACASEYLATVRGMAGPDRDRLRFDSFFALGGAYLAQLGTVLKDAGRLAKLRRSALLSRYVGVLRFSIDEAWFLDLVVDTTDIKRDRGEASALLLATGRDATVVESLNVIAEQLGGLLVV